MAFGCLRSTGWLCSIPVHNLHTTSSWGKHGRPPSMTTSLTIIWLHLLHLLWLLQATVFLSSNGRPIETDRQLSAINWYYWTSPWSKRITTQQPTLLDVYCGRDKWWLGKTYCIWLPQPQFVTDRVLSVTCTTTTEFGQAMTRLHDEWFMGTTLLYRSGEINQWQQLGYRLISVNKKLRIPNAISISHRLKRAWLRPYVMRKNRRVVLRTALIDQGALIVTMMVTMKASLYSSFLSQGGNQDHGIHR